MSSAYREQILNLHSKSKLNHLEVPHSIQGPGGERLFTDYFFTPEKRDFCLVHLSGVHGVEGYLGSLIQQEILKQNLENLPFQLVIVHTVNPYGMAAKIRTNASNVDLNRNSLSHYKIDNPHFKHFLPFLKSGKFFDFLKTCPHILKLGIEKTARTVACGQSDYPDAIFFCGKERQPELVSLKRNLEFLIDKKTKIFALDVHTGLGKMGQESLIIEGFDSNEEMKFESIFNKKMTLPDRDPDFYNAQGTLGNLLRESWQSLHCFQEFGTKPFYVVLQAMIHQNPEKMFNAFFPDHSSWRKRCVDLGLLRFQQLVQNLSK